VTADAASWREQAVERSLDSARSRAERRVQRFLDAALELMAESPDKEFTVQEVVEQSGQSLRSFYQHFGGKQELLMAVFEEVVRSTAAALLAVVADVDDPSERLHRLTAEYYRRCQPKSGSVAPALAEFTQQLLTAHPDDAARAFAPMVALFDEVLSPSVTGVLLHSVMFHTFASTIAGVSSSRDNAEELCDLLFNGMAAR
jgi:AcrR family transcriptional regulator